MANGTSVKQEMVSIPKSEYDGLIETAAKIELIEEIIHKPEATEDVEKKLKEGYEEMTVESLRVAEEWKHTEREVEENIGDWSGCKKGRNLPC